MLEVAKISVVVDDHGEKSWDKSYIMLIEALRDELCRKVAAETAATNVLSLKRKRKNKR